MCEVRDSAQRLELLRTVLARGLAYVGQIDARPAAMNDVINDVFVNVSHLVTYFPGSRALLSSGLAPLVRKIKAPQTS